jgi:WD40 repeat protein
MSEISESVEPRDSPYFGLDYFDEKFGGWFFGREAESGKIITNLRAARLTLLHAESGVGKSSLLRAGVAWRMRKLADDSLARRGTVRSVPVVFSLWKDDPLKDLSVMIRAAIAPYLAGRPEPELPAGRLDETIAAAADALNASLFIMLDQFEEYFLYRSREPVPEQFADELARCINRADLRANFLIAIREDAYAGLGDLFKGRIANVYGNYLHVDYLDRASAERAIREPLDIYNSQPGVSEQVKIQDELVGAVLDQVRAFGSDGGALLDPMAAANGGSAERVATPLLQLVMETVWQQERKERSDELRLSTLQNLHGVRMIVDAHLGKALSALGSGERQTAMDVFDHLVTPSGGKIAESVPDLAKRTGHSEEQVGSILEKLDHERIVRPIPAAPGQDPMRYRRYEIFHDVLSPTINRAIAAREDRRRARRLRRLAALAVALLIVALAVAGVFAYLLHAANTEKVIAESRQLAADADLNLASDPELSTLLAMKALHLDHTNQQAVDALRAALPQIQDMGTYQARTPVSSAVFDPADTSRVVSAGNDGSAWIWNAKTGRHIAPLSPQGGFGQDGSADVAAFNPTGTEVAIGYSLGQVALFDARSGKELQSADAGSQVNGAQFVGSTGVVAIATMKGVYLWTPGNGSKPVPMLLNGANTLSGGANSIAAYPGNPLKLAVSTSNGTVILEISQNDRSIMRQQSLSQGQPQDTADGDAEFSPNGQQVVTADSDGAVRVYDLVNSKVVQTLAVPRSIPDSVAFSPDGQLIVAGYSSGLTLVWDAATGTPLTQLAGNPGPVWTARFNASSSEVVTAGEDGTIRLWHAQPREVRTSFTSPSGGPPQIVFAAQYSPDGGRILTVDGSGNASVFTAGGQPAGLGGQPVVLNPGATYPNSAVFNHNGTLIVTADEDGTVDLWGGGPDYSQLSFPTPIKLNGPALYAAFSPDSTRIVVVTSNDTAEVFSRATGKLLQTLDPGQGFTLSVAVYSPDGRQILTGDDNGQVEVWNAATGTKIRPLGTPGPQINDVEFNRDGSQFVTASGGGVITVWAADHDRPLLSVNACPSPSTASFSPGGSMIVVACGDGTVRVRDAVTGHQIIVLSSPGLINSAAFSPDGKSIVTAFQANNAGGVQIWTTELARASLQNLEGLAEQRVTRKLTPAEQSEYLTGISG